MSLPYVFEFARWFAALMLVIWYASGGKALRIGLSDPRPVGRAIAALALATMAATLGGLQTHVFFVMVFGNPWLPLVAAAGALGVIRVWIDVQSYLHRDVTQDLDDVDLEPLPLQQPLTRPPSLMLDSPERDHEPVALHQMISQTRRREPHLTPIGMALAPRPRTHPSP
jgi:hypothetical protein